MARILPVIPNRHSVAQFRHPHEGEPIIVVAVAAQRSLPIVVY